MLLDNFKLQVQDEISRFILEAAPKEALEMINYAVFPPGKMIRPALVWAWCIDNKFKVTNKHIKLAASLEIHHAYTLVHDDLPDMDNDDFRRGKPSHHKMYNPALAILTGDILLALSLKVLNDIDNKRLNKLYHWSIGAKGLIRGQILDLENTKNNLKTILRIFELKTARLFQLAILGTNLISKDNQIQYDDYIKSLRLGSYLGILFQVCDDEDDFQKGDIKELNIFRDFHQDANNIKDTIRRKIQLNYKEYTETLQLFEKYLP